LNRGGRPLKLTVRCPRGSVASSSTLKVFFATAIPFGAAMALPRLGHFHLPYVIGMGVVMGSLFGGAMAWSASRSARRLKAEGIDPGNMEPAQDRSVEVVGSLTTVHEASRQALLTLKKLKIVKDNSQTGELDARTGVSWRSHGENITVRITGDGPHATVHISTRPRLSTTTTDGGKGAENVGLFVRSLLLQVPEAAPNPRLERP
jgi:hypothetical protein